ncbi:MAG TPA: hypothetical protein V6C58_01390, partial [Allocoleopsis sp.]
MLKHLNPLNPNNPDKSQNSKAIRDQIKATVLSIVKAGQFLSEKELQEIDLELIIEKLKIYSRMPHPRDITTAQMGTGLIYPQYDTEGR